MILRIVVIKVNCNLAEISTEKKQDNLARLEGVSVGM